MNLLHKIGGKPIIAALRNPEEIHMAVASNVDNIFIMGGTIIEVTNAIRLAKENDKGAFVHLDLVRGLSNTDKESVEYIANYMSADGIITPKSHLIREAKKLGLYGILHLFVIDSLSVQNGLKLVETIQPDAIELMPGVVSKTISIFSESHNIPIIGSGLIQTKREVMECLEAGATSLSVSEQSIWSLTFDQCTI